MFLMKDMTYIQEIKSKKKSRSRHIIVKLHNPKDNEEILKVARGKRQITQKGTSVKLTADFSSTTTDVS